MTRDYKCNKFDHPAIRIRTGSTGWSARGGAKFDIVFPDSMRWLGNQFPFSACLPILHSPSLCTLISSRAPGSAMEVSHISSRQTLPVPPPRPLVGWTNGIPRMEVHPTDTDSLGATYAELVPCNERDPPHQIVINITVTFAPAQGIALHSLLWRPWRHNRQLIVIGSYLRRIFMRLTHGKFQYLTFCI